MADLAILGRPERTLVRSYPWIPWLAPHIVAEQGRAPLLVCRFCTVQRGLRGGLDGFPTRDEWDHHLRDHHQWRTPRDKEATS